MRFEIDEMTLGNSFTFSFLCLIWFCINSFIILMVGADRDPENEWPLYAFQHEKACERFIWASANGCMNISRSIPASFTSSDNIAVQKMLNMLNKSKFLFLAYKPFHTLLNMYEI